MKQPSSLSTLGLLLVVLLAPMVSPTLTFAKETSQNFVIPKEMHYFWNRWNSNPNINTQSESAVIQQSQSQGAGWTPALANPNVTIFYRARVVDNVTGTLLTDSANIPIGTVLRLEFEPHLSTDISWFGTGYSMDSPYGEWRSGATAPALTSQTRGGPAGMLPTCASKDYVNSVNPYGIGLDVYIPFVVNPPAKAITTSANLSCNAPDGSGNRTCTVTSAGPISVSFDYSSTYGKFFYRYIDYRQVNGAPAWGAGPGCYGNNVAIRPKADTDYVAQSAPVCWTECETISCMPAPQYYDYGTPGGDYNGGGCFRGDTMVLMADGSEKPIQDIVVGDKVLGENELTGEREINTVTTHFVHEGSFPMLVVNGTLHVTAEHRIKIERDSTISWIGAGELLVGDVLVGTEDAVPVVSIEPGEVLHRVYNLTTFPSHTYFAGGVLVHNIKNFDMNFN